MKRTILICDDEKNIREGLALAMQGEGYATLTAENAEKAWDLVNKEDVDLVITDLRMDGMGGEELLKRIHGAYPQLPVIILTGHGTIETAVVAMRDGAIDFFTKPVDLDRLTLVVGKALKNRDLQAEHDEMKQELDDYKARDKYNKVIIGKSQKMTHLMDTIAQIAPTVIPVLITGESGVGKELAADAIEEFSKRHGKPFIKLHCASLPDTLLEDALFGHEKGAFTGAVDQRKGRFEDADGGTLFLDEIGEISKSTQVKLLRILQEKQFERLGGNKTITVDVRIISATNRNLEEAIKDGSFREDLYYRIKGVEINVPPLRERKEDIPLLIASFLDKFNKENDRNVEGFTEKAKHALYSYDWPGNIRELQNCIMGAAAICRTSLIDVGDLPPTVTKAEAASTVNMDVGITLAEGEKRLIISTLEKCGGNKTKAAQVLDIGRKTLHRKLQEYQIEDNDDDQ
ncbi:MAG: sigma-54 dependent transcriptional regulator [Sphaerochaeta sp.]|jgi:DNA-binding NtrC family response regulator|nr:sigma-54 dependent transcriptional regulator [Sphaerochaeta sp.]MCH3921041.1 sigma-54 dependent transcriptional regulator [Sphaerochaeta sp.]MCI2045408.1 sigma-54 dependent transcriptional regulator [Sphaerochaeta sp.]MCI2076904.1 sigma-54 dependent transcriptional regulator [Sphaerochaeta sp.]MCI2097831.1 sigma-54 dependent transcriptional regulator [Sphaerochaeta sp.]